MDSTKFVNGYGLFDSSYYCWHVSEKVEAFLGAAVKRSLLEIISSDDVSAFREVTGRLFAREENASEIELGLKGADGLMHRCHLYLRLNGDGLCEFEMVEVNNAVAVCIPNIISLYEFKFLFEREKRKLFEYSYDTGVLELFCYENHHRVLLEDGEDIAELRRLILDEITNQSNGVEFDFVKVLPVNGKNYYARGVAIMKGMRLSKLFGTISLRREELYRDENHELVHDAMTGLYNKPHALNLARKAVTEKQHENIALVMIDVDNFKSINDSFGHLFGDEVIKSLAVILRDVTYGRGFAGRFGGDEFFLCLWDLKDEEQLRSILMAVYMRYRDAFPEKDFAFTLSMGIARFPENGDDFDLLLRKTDAGLYRAKFKGKNRFIIFREELHADLLKNADSTSTLIDKADRDRQAAGFRGIILKLTDAALCGPEERRDCLEQALSEFMRLYNIEGISYYREPDFKCVYRIGSYSDPLPDAAYMRNKNALFCFTPDGYFSGNVKNALIYYVDDFHGYITEHKLVFSFQVIEGSREDAHGMIAFDREHDLGTPSDEEKKDMILVAKLLMKLAK